MTFEEMFQQATNLGISLVEMRKNCAKQIDQYRELSRKPGDRWDVAASGAADMLVWLDQKTA